MNPELLFVQKHDGTYYAVGTLGADGETIERLDPKNLALCVSNGWKSAESDLAVCVKQMPGLPDLKLPEYETEGSAGFDIRAYLDTTGHKGSSTWSIRPGETVMIPTGLYMSVPRGFELQIRSRSGWASKGLVVANSPGTIDSDYRGEIKVLLHNNTLTNPISVTHGDRIAQGVISPVRQASFQFVDELPSTDRGEKGFGSTGNN